MVQIIRKNCHHLIRDCGIIMFERNIKRMNPWLRPSPSGGIPKEFPISKHRTCRLCTRGLGQGRISEFLDSSDASLGVDRFFCRMN